jgi:DNA-binding transcriptional MerR regulator
LSEKTVRIGKLAELCGVTVCALRVYERKGLIKPLYRAPNGYRYYDPSLQLPVRVFRSALSLGLSLAELGQIFAGATPLQREPTAAEARASIGIAAQIYQRHLAAIDDEVRRLAELRGLLERRLDYCRGELNGSGRIGVPSGDRRRLSKPGRIEYVPVTS